MNLYLSPVFHVGDSICFYYNVEWLQRFAGHVSCIIFCYNTHDCEEGLCIHDGHLLDYMFQLPP